MRTRLWPRVWSALLITLLVGCRQQSQETAATLPAPTAAPTATAAPAATEPALATATPTQAPMATPSPDHLPAGWQRAGSADIGLELGLPAGWVDLSDSVELAALTGRFGRRVVLLADSLQTGRDLAGGATVGGAFLLGYVGETPAAGDQPAVNPVAGLAELLESATPSAATTVIVPIGLHGRPAAYADLAFDPTELIDSEQLRFRLLFAVEPVTGRPAVLLMGSAAAQWPNYLPLFEHLVQTMRLHPVDLVMAMGSLVGGQAVGGTLERGVTHLWMFAGAPGRFATISLASASAGLDLTLTLVSPAGRTVESADSSQGDSTEMLADVLLTDEGLYTIQISEFYEQPGPYELALFLNDVPQLTSGGRLALGHEITAELQPNAAHRWRFAGSAGQTVTIIVSPLNEQLDIILELFSPDGTKLTVWDESFSGDPEIMSGLRGFWLPITGDYTLLVRGFIGHGGRYTISLNEGGSNLSNFHEVGDLYYGDVRSEALLPAEAQTWFIEGRAGDQIELAITPLEGNLDLQLWLLHANVENSHIEPLATRDEFLAGEAETLQWNLPVDGLYVALVFEFHGRTGSYEITLNVESTAVTQAAGSLSYGQTVTANLADGERAVWSFDGRAGETISVVLTPGDADDNLVIWLQEPAGNTAVRVNAAAAGAIERLMSFTLTASGTWQIVVQEYDERGADYQLALSK